MQRKHTRAHTAFTAAIAIAALGCSLAGCTAASPSAEPITLHMGTDDFPGRVAADQVSHFAEAVDKLSSGRITIEPVWKAARSTDGTYLNDWDQAVARMVQDGDLELGLIPSRAWDTEGVDSLRPLQAPFLITDDAHLAAVLADAVVAKALVAGLEEAGVVGLGLLPEGLRHPFAVSDPLEGPDTYAGANFRVPTSDTSRMIYTTLGATTDDDAPAGDKHQGLESSFALLPGGVGVGNVTFYPKANVIVVNQDVLASLAAADQALLREAATQTLDWAIETQVPDSEAARAFCDEGNAVVLAAPEDVVALEEATAGIVDEIAAMGENAATIEAIVALAAGAEPSAPVAACGSVPVVEPDTNDAAINGVYRFEMTLDEATAAAQETCAAKPDIIGCTPSHSTGVTLPSNAGEWEFTFEDGTYRLVQQPLMGDEYTTSGTYSIDGDRLSLTWPAEPGSPTEIYRWALVDGDLHLEVIDDAGWWWSYAATQEPWERVE